MPIKLPIISQSFPPPGEQHPLCRGHVWGSWPKKLQNSWGDRLSIQESLVGTRPGFRPIFFSVFWYHYHTSQVEISVENLWQYDNCQNLKGVFIAKEMERSHATVVFCLFSWWFFTDSNHHHYSPPCGEDVCDFQVSNQQLQVATNRICDPEMARKIHLWNQVGQWNGNTPPSWFFEKVVLETVGQVVIFLKWCWNHRIKSCHLPTIRWLSTKQRFAWEKKYPQRGMPFFPSKLSQNKVHWSKIYRKKPGPQRLFEIHKNQVIQFVTFLGWLYKWPFKG